MSKTPPRNTRARTPSKRRETLVKLDLSRAGLSDNGRPTTDDEPAYSSDSWERKRKNGHAIPLLLRSVRLAAGKTQGDVSKATGIAQGDVCRLEQRETLDECQVSTLRRFVEALGGRLDVNAVFAGGQRVALKGWDDPDS
jgi:hypothetical protein